MGTYHVQPLPDEVKPAYGWQVKQQGVGRRSHHYKKRAAKRKARKLASSGDKIALHRKNGTIHKWIEVR